MDIEKERADFKIELAHEYNMREVDTVLGKSFVMGSTNQAFKAWQAAKAQAAPEWISTEDKEPVENGNYLVCIDGDVFYLTAKWVKNHFKFLARGYGLTEDFTDWRYCEGVKVTHWMLLPDSPKAQEPAND